MRKGALLFVCISAWMICVTIGCKDKKPEVVPVDSMSVVDSIVEEIVEDTVPEDAMDSLISSTPMPKAADELFDDFLFNFTANKKLQYDRVKFPLKVMEGDHESFIERKDWKIEKFFMKQEFFTLILDDESQLSLSKDTTVDNVIIEKINLKEKSVEQHVFNREDGLWMLTSINRNTVYQNPNKSFLNFYERFASDSLFQIESMNDPVNTILPDPDDDFTMIEGEFHPDQWPEFCPMELPSDFIYNVIYGQTYSQANQKLFVIRGISNGLEAEMTFKNKGGNWKLTKIIY